MSTIGKTMGVIAILATLGIAWWLISPLFITKEVSESIEDIAPQASNDAPAQPAASVSESKTPHEASPTTALETVASGTFIGLERHQAAGTAKLIKAQDSYTVRFEEDFTITNGPDLYVHLGKDGQYDPNARLERLKGNVGAQNYAVPASVDISQYNEVWVWCRAFSIPFGKASLQ